jgi:hypothetical protein
MNRLYPVSVLLAAILLEEMEFDCYRRDHAVDSAAPLLVKI